MRSVPCILTLLLTTITAHAAHAVDATNAALWYWRAIDHFRDVPCTDAIAIELDSFDATTQPTDELRHLVAEQGEPIIGELLRGTSADHCHFAVDWDAHLGAHLPHVTPMHRCATILAVSAADALDTGDDGRAAELLACGYRLADHVGHNGCLQTAQEAHRIYLTMDRLTARGLEADTFDTAERRVLFEALARIDLSDPFGLVSAIDREVEILTTFAEQALVGDDASVQLLRRVTTAKGETEAAESALPSALVHESAARLPSLLAGAREAFNNHDRVAGADELASIEKQLTIGESPSEFISHPDFVAAILWPDFIAAHDLVAASERAVLDRIDSLSLPNTRRPVPDGYDPPRHIDDRLYHLTLYWHDADHDLSQFSPHEQEAIAVFALNAAFGDGVTSYYLHESPVLYHAMIRALTRIEMFEMRGYFVRMTELRRQYASFYEDLCGDLPPDIREEIHSVDQRCRAFFSELYDAWNSAYDRLLPE